MKTWSFYDPLTGMFSGHVFGGSAELLTLNTPPGLLPIQGRFDRLCQRVDLESGSVVDWRPPRPDADYEWNTASRRWVKRAEVQRREAERASALTRIEELERKQARRVRELLAASDPMLTEIDQEIASLRAQL